MLIPGIKFTNFLLEMYLGCNSSRRGSALYSEEGVSIEQLSKVNFMNQSCIPS